MFHAIFHLALKDNPVSRVVQVLDIATCAYAAVACSGEVGKNHQNKLLPGHSPSSKRSAFLQHFIEKA